MSAKAAQRVKEIVDELPDIRLADLSNTAKSQAVLKELDDCLNEVELREWLRNAPAMKPMYTDPESLKETDGLPRGMPFLALSEDQIDQLVAYLLERK